MTLMDRDREIRTLVLIVGVALAFYFTPLGSPRVRGAVLEALSLVQWYAREHMVFGLLPAFFIAGAISVFVSQASVMRYLGAHARRGVAYAVASVSGSFLAVCSCTILPLFAGIYSRGAGLGPATAFLYAGPAINVMAIILTARVLGPQIGVARAVGAVGFSVVIGLAMHAIFRKEEAVRAEAALAEPPPAGGRPVGHTLALFVAMIAVLAFANWGAPAGASGIWRTIFVWKWALTAGAGVALATLLVLWLGIPAWKMIAAAVPVAVVAAIARGNPLAPFLAGVAGITVAAVTTRGEARSWIEDSWGFAKEILPLLLVGILVVGFLLGRPGRDSLIPESWITGLVGGNSVLSNLVASVAGGFMYFCTLTEVPIVQGLVGAGMGKGPALAFLLAGPAVSLPNILILRSIVGGEKTATYITLVIVTATLSGLVFGAVFG
jgi:uncharacterized membrane protein YraQ (UPF0718 family)